MIKPQTIRVLGTKIHMAEIDDVCSYMETILEIEPGIPHHFVNTGMHGLMEAYRDPEIRRIFEAVEMFAPDGILVVLLAKLRGFRIKKENTGPNLLWEFSRRSNIRGYKHYFYGDEEPVLIALESRLQSSFPFLKIVGHRSPPFRTLTAAENDIVIRQINEAAPDVLWVGLGMPKQEQWISDHLSELKVPIVVGAGAAFKFFSGHVTRCPLILQRIGLEWLWRMVQEPRRIWRRVVIDAPQFVFLVSLELAGLKKF